jgi:hypothetical protein
MFKFVENSNNAYILLKKWFLDLLSSFIKHVKYGSNNLLYFIIYKLNDW